MPVTYAGVPLLCSTDEACAWCSANMSLADLIADSLRLYFPTGLGKLSSTWQGMLERRVEPGKFFFPGRGASRFAVATFLATDATIALLQPLVAPVTGGLVQNPLTMSAVDALTGKTLGSITASMYLLPPRPIAAITGLPNIPPQLAQMWVVTLVDSRFFFSRMNSGSLRNSLVPGVAGFQPGVTTWSTLMLQLATNVGMGLLVDGVNANYGFPPASVAIDYDNAPALLDGLSYSVGQGIVFPLTGTVAKSQRQDNAYPLAYSNSLMGTVVAGGTFPGAFTQANLPKQIFVLFPQAAGDPFPIVANLNGNGQSFIWTYHHSAVYTGQNLVALTNLANQLATDLNVWLQPICDVTFQGIVPVVVNALQDFEWSYRVKRTTLAQLDIEGPALELPDDGMVEPELLSELDGEVGWYDTECTTRVMPAPYLDWWVPATCCLTVQDTRQCVRLTMIGGLLYTTTDYVYVNGLALFPQNGGGNYVVVIDQEQIEVNTYSAADAQPGVLAIVQRGFNGTTVAGHADNSFVCQIPSATPSMGNYTATSLYSGMTATTTSMVIPAFSGTTNVLPPWPIYGNFMVGVTTGGVTEYMLVTDGTLWPTSGASATLTVVRAQLGSTQVLHNSGDLVQLVLPDSVVPVNDVIFEDGVVQPGPQPGMAVVKRTEQLFQVIGPSSDPNFVGYYDVWMCRYNGSANQIERYFKTKFVDPNTLPVI